MPEFQLNDNTDCGPNNDFVAGYIEAMFFTNGDTGDPREYLLNELGTARLTREALTNIKRDCAEFLCRTMPDGCSVQQWLDRTEDYDERQAGRDFWFTRQHHGVGYWDREQLQGYQGDCLTDAAHAMGEAYVEVYRGWIYHR